MNSHEVHIQASDCLPFNHKEVTADIIQEFIASQSKNVFWFTPALAPSQDEAKLAEYDYVRHQWVAGRFVGEALFNFKNTTYKITIKPRFGEGVLLQMLEEIYNIRITSSAGSTNKAQDWRHFIKRIIAFIWIQKLANANLHGVPKVQIRRKHKGAAIKGRVNVRASVLPYKAVGEIVSLYNEKDIDYKIAAILNEAYHILKNDFDIGHINLPDSAQDALNHIFRSKPSRRLIKPQDYKSIKYKEIYKSWKPVVDLSWDIIQQKQMSLKQQNSENGFGFFLDMAEIWEQYLRVILKKYLSPLGWHYTDTKQTAYKDYFFRRSLIPDLVFQKDNDIAVWDAKYKRMNGRQIDVDRGDFFQIHTYIQNFNHKTVKTGGLFYPLSLKENVELSTYRSPYLINEEGQKIIFAIDGLELNEEKECHNFKEKERQFINRIKNDLHPSS